MRVLMPAGMEGVQLLRARNDGDVDRLTDLAEPWRSVDVEIVNEDENGLPLRFSNAPWLANYFFAVDSTAQTVIEPLLRDRILFLPITCLGRELFALKPPRINALNEVESRVRRLTAGRIWRVDQYVLRKEIVDSHHMFALSSMKAGPILVDGDFVELWTSSGLTGLDFKEVWQG